MIIRSNKINEGIMVKDNKDLPRVDKEFRSKFYPKIIAVFKSANVTLYAQMGYSNPGKPDIFRHGITIKTARASNLISKPAYYDSSVKSYTAPYFVAFTVEDGWFSPQPLIAIQGVRLNNPLGIFSDDRNSVTAVRYYKVAEEVLGPDQAKELMNIAKSIASYLDLPFEITDDKKKRK